MNRKIKKQMAFMLCLVLCVSLFPTLAFAEDMDAETAAKEPAEVVEEIVTENEVSSPEDAQELTEGDTVEAMDGADETVGPAETEEVRIPGTEDNTEIPETEDVLLEKAEESTILDEKTVILEENSLVVEEIESEDRSFASNQYLSQGNSSSLVVLSDNLMLENINYWYEAGNDGMNPGSVGSLHFTGTVVGPSSIANAWIGTWFDSQPSAASAQEMAETIVSYWREGGYSYPGDAPPFEFHNSRPVFEDDLGKTEYNLLIGIDKNINLVGYAVVKADIPGSPQPQTGWVKDSDGWCWYDSNGNQVKNKWIQSDGVWYYIDDSGHRIENGWAKDSGGWCWLGADGKQVENKWIKSSGAWYYIDGNGHRIENGWAKDSGGWCWLGADGKQVESTWITTNGKKYYVDANGHRVTGTQIINGKKYTFDSDGALIT